MRIIRRRLEERTWAPEQASELAVEWGLTDAVVRGHAAEAQRQLEAVLDDRRGEVTIAADLEAGLDLAFEQGDPYAVRGLIAEKLKLHGIGGHRDPKNDPKPTGTQPETSLAPDLASLPPWERAKVKPAKPS